jgi:hypothetical protein
MNMPIICRDNNINKIFVNVSDIRVCDINCKSKAHTAYRKKKMNDISNVTNMDTGCNIICCILY